MQTRAWPTVGYTRSGIQITRFGTTPGGRLGDRAADHIGGYLKSFLDNPW